MATTEERLETENDVTRDSIPSDLLPPVEAPSAGFILQLFVIPLMIVAIIVLVFFFLNYMAHMGSNPNEAVGKLKKGDEAAWQKAVNLSNMLRNPQNEHLKHDAGLCLELADVLKESMQEGSMQEHKIKLRIYLCKLLGEFLVDTGLPALKLAAETERDAAEIEPPNPRKVPTLREVDVRRTALEAIALLMKNVGVEKYQRDPELLNLLIKASRERGVAQRDEHLRAEVRSAAAFALGVLGGDDALGRLEVMLGDAYPNARFNAAVGLARHGDERSIGRATEPAGPVVGLLEMLDPDNKEVAKDEQFEAGFTFKRELVLVTGIRASVRLRQKNTEADLTDLRATIEKLVSGDVPASVQNEARKALQSFRKQP